MKYFNNKQQMYKRNKVLNRRDADNLIVASHKLFMMIGCLALNQAFRSKSITATLRLMLHRPCDTFRTYSKKWNLTVFVVKLRSRHIKASESACGH